MNITVDFMKRKVDGKLVDWIEFSQRQVMIDGRRVAYCGSKPGMPICFLREVGEDIKASVKEAVDKHNNGPSGRLAGPAPLIEDPSEGDADND